MRYTGLAIAFLIITLWVLSTFFWLGFDLSFTSPWTWFGLLLQTHLYTGLFITAHDAMHGTIVPRSKIINKAVGVLCALLFAFNYYPTLIRKHHEHHRFVATDKDPDYHEGGFWIWYLSFARQYVTIFQFIMMGLAFNVLICFFPEKNVMLYWAVPSVLSTFQLFYFGTYIPHRKAPGNKHFSRSQKMNHLYAFLTCYFFGYHYEHHDSPATPWWQLYKRKEENQGL